MKIKILLLTIALFLGSLGVKGQTTVFTDDFSTNQNGTFTTTGVIGASAWTVGRSGIDMGARRHTSPSQLELTNDASGTANVNGWVYAYANLSGFTLPFNGTLSSNTGTVTWNVNLRQIRTDPSGLMDGNYGVAHVLVASSNNINNTGTGYAIVLGQSGSTDPIRLVSYSNGLRGTLTDLITSNTTGLTDFGANYLSVKVTYSPSTNTWELFLRNDGNTAFVDPTSGTLTSQGTVVNSTNTGTAMTSMGFFWSASTAASQTAFFDNISVTVAGSDTTPPTVTTLSPLDDATDVATTSNLVLTFNENVVRGTGTILIKRVSDNDIVQTIDVTNGARVIITNNIVTIDPLPNLPTSSALYVEIPNTAFRDTAGNFYAGISGNSTWNFTTAAPPTPVITVSDNGTQVAAGNVAQGTLDHMLAAFKIDVANSNTTLTGATITLTGNYLAADIGTQGLKIRASSTNNFASGGALQSIASTSTGTGETISFTGLSQLLTTASPVYFWITASFNPSAMDGRTIRALGINASDLTFSSGTSSGSVTAGGVQTITGTSVGTSATDYFRTRQDGAWATATNWESSSDNSNWITATLAPTSAANTITILNTHDITVASGSVTADDLTVNDGGTLTISGGTFTLNNGVAPIDLQVNGSLTYSGGTFTQGSSGIAFGANSTYNHSITSGTLTLPIATWNATSTCNVTGMTNSGPISASATIGQTFGNFIWNNASQGSFVNIENSAFRVNGTLTVGPTSNVDNKLSFGNNPGTFNNTVNAIVVTGGQLNGVGNSATVNLTVTTSINISGGIMAVSDGSGTANISVGSDLNLSGTGELYVLNKGASPTQTLNITGDLTISGTGYLNMEFEGAGVATINVGRDFICTATDNPTIDFGDGSVAGNVINITRNFSKSGTGQFQTFSNSQATGFAFVGNGTFSYSGANSDYTSYIVQNGATLQLNSNLTLGTETNPPSYFTVANGGTLNFGTNSIIAGNTTDPRFITTLGASLITANTNGLGGTTAAGSVQSFGSVSDTSVAGRATFANGTNYTFNGNTTTPFPNGTIGSAATININADVTSNYAATLAVTTAFNVNGTNVFRQNPANNNNIALSGIMTIATGATFDNNGSNQITSSGTPSIVVNGTFITRDPDGFVGSNTSIPSITPVLNPGSTVEFGAAGNQTVQGGTAPTYQNITFSNGGTKTLVSANTVVGTISVLGTTIFDAGNSTFGSGTSTITMTGSSLYKLGGSGVKPDSGGTYTLGSDSTFEFTGASATQIRVAPLYANVIISGTNVKAGSTDDAGLTFQNPGIFKVTNTGVFKVTNTAGFTGSTTSAIKNNSNPTITLETGSTVEYSRSGNQTIAAQSGIVQADIDSHYSNLRLSGSGTKSFAGTTLKVGNDLDVAGTSLLPVSGTQTLIVNKKITTVDVNTTVNTAPNTSIDATQGILIKNNGSLVQIDNVDNNSGNLNTGKIQIERITQPMVRLDYTYWSSPIFANNDTTVDVGEFTLFNLSPTTPVTRFYRWNPEATTQAAGWIAQNPPSAFSMIPGRGYIVRAPNGFSPTIAQPYTANFIGRPNNGTVYAEVYGGDPDPVIVDPANPLPNWNLIGNPYPSAIDADLFLDANTTNPNQSLGGTLYFWTHNTPGGSAGNPYTPNDYASWNGTGSTGTAALSGTGGGNNNAPTGKIAAGQSFFIKGINSIPGTFDAVFNNSMRVAGQNDQFFKPASAEFTATPAPTKHRVWLNLTGATQGFNQTLVGYIQNATNDVDNRFDGESFGGNQVTLYSVLNNRNLVIQGRALPFVDSDTVPLGYKTTLTGNLTLSIDHVDGLMETQNIYLQDNLLNVVHDLKQSSYTFASVPGTFNSRFVLRYTPQENLSTPSFNDQIKSVAIYKNNDNLYVHSPYESIATVTVYDITGRIIFEQKDCNTNRFETNALLTAQQVWIVKVTLANGGVVTKKVG